jgi:osmotically inducible lipoprotein OsmB
MACITGSFVMVRSLTASTLAAIILLSLAGCGDTAGGRALSGGAIGAGGGAIIGGATGVGAGTGALIGAGVGAGTGAVTTPH